MIRRCIDSDFDEIFVIINDAARAYEGVIPVDRWKEPYMSKEELSLEMKEGVVFWGYEEDDQLIGVMGIQDVKDVSLIRHAYVRTTNRNQGIGGKLLSHLHSQTTARPLSGRHVGRRCMGDSILRKTWLSTGQQRNERPPIERILVYTRNAKSRPPSFWQTRNGTRPRLTHPTRPVGSYVSNLTSKFSLVLS